MFAFALDVPPLPLWSTPVVAYRREVTERPDPLSRHLNLARGYEPGNALTTSPSISAPIQDWTHEFRPKTGLGKRLLALRQAYVASGGRLVSAAELDDELRQRRGGVDDA